MDWILLKALEKDRCRRYATTSDLANDLRRFLKNVPVLAGPPSGLYRLRKFVRRNRAFVFSSVAVLVAIFTGLMSIAVIQARNAETQAQNAREQGRLRQIADESAESERIAPRETVASLAEAHARAAALAAQRGSWDIAVQEISHAIEFGHPVGRELRLQRVRWLITGGRRTEARDKLDAITLQESDRAAQARTHLLRGLLAVGDTSTRATAQGWFKKAEAVGLEGADNLYVRGLQAHTARQALTFFQAAIEEEPFHYLAWNGKILTLAFMGSLTETIQTADTVISMFPDDMTAHAYRALATHLKGDPERSQALLKDASGSFTDAQFEQIEALLDTLTSLRQLLSATDQPRKSPVQQLLSLIARIPAIQGLNQELLFVHTSPNIPFIGESYGKILPALLAAAIGKIDRAEELLDEATQANPCSFLYWLRGTITGVSDHGNFAGAEQAIRHALELEPFFPELEILLLQTQVYLQGYRLEVLGQADARKRLLKTLWKIARREELHPRLLNRNSRRALNLGETALARVLVERWRQLDPDGLEPKIRSAEIDLQDGAFCKTLMAANMILAKHPGNENAIRIRATAETGLRQASDDLGQR